MGIEEAKKHHTSLLILLLFRYHLLEICDELIEFKIIFELILLFIEENFVDSLISNIFGCWVNYQKSCYNNNDLTFISNFITLKSFNQYTVSDKPYICQAARPIYSADPFIIVVNMYLVIFLQVNTYYSV
jgi:hypothetical protein